jgi:hypothetical protein
MAASPMRSMSPFWTKAACSAPTKDMTPIDRGWSLSPSTTDRIGSAMIFSISATITSAVRSRFGVRIQFEQNQCFMLSHFS